VSDAKFVLEHFYYGQLVTNNKPTGDQRILAMSAGVSPKLAEQAVERVILPPFMTSKSGSWAIVRGRNRLMPFLMVQAQQGSMGQLIAHYIFITPDLLKAIFGNLRGLLSMVQENMPVFDKPDNKLKPIEFLPPRIRTNDEEIDDILELMTLTGNKLPTIENLLGGIVKGTPVIIQGAPADLNQRVQFIQGLLSLLPSSARYGVTFTTHSQPTNDNDAQIRFYSDDVPPTDATVFNWTRKQMLGIVNEDPYSHFIISQLRLDTELVIQRNNAMTAVAGWRFNLGDKLSDALGYASQRVRVDEALRSSQPVDKDEVSRILAEDPTLSDELRALYAGHLVKFSLAMRDMTLADPVAMLLREDSQLERIIWRQMEQSLNEGQGWLLHETLIKWITNPLGPQGQDWVDLTHRAGLSRLKKLVDEQDSDGIGDFLKDLQSADDSLHVERIIQPVLRFVLPLSGDSHIAENVFLLALKYLDPDAFKRLMNQDKFRERLNPNIIRAWGVLNSETKTAQAGEILVKASRSFGETWEGVVLLRFCEIAQENKQQYIFSPSLLQRLYHVLSTPEGGLQSDRLRKIIAPLEERAILITLEHPSPRILLQMRLLLGDYQELAQQMIKQLSALYSGDNQQSYLDMVNEVFSKTPVPLRDVSTMLKAINQYGVKSVPYIVASMSTLQRHTGAAELDDVALRIGQQLFDERYLIDVVPPAAILNLMDHYASRRSLEGLEDIATVVPYAMVELGAEGAKTLVEIYKKIEWNSQAKAKGIEILAGYIRLLDETNGRKVMTFLLKELSPTLRPALEVAYTLKRLLGEMNLLEYAQHLQHAVDFLTYTHQVYVDPKRAPIQGTIVNGLAAIPGKLDRADHSLMINNILEIGETIVGYAKQHRLEYEEDARIARLLTAKQDPASAYEVVRVIAGQLIPNNERVITKLSSPDIRYPLDGKTIPILFRDINATHFILHSLRRAIPETQPLRLPVGDIAREVHHIVASLIDTPSSTQLQDIGRNLQQVINLVIMIQLSSDTKAFENPGFARKVETGGHRPRNTLEFYRFIYGYYGGHS
jgi:hypothetical protein